MHVNALLLIVTVIVRSSHLMASKEPVDIIYLQIFQIFSFILRHSFNFVNILGAVQYYLGVVSEHIL